MKTASFHTLGCKLNFAESSALGRTFAEAGYRVVGPEDPSDVFVLNTCTVTERADRECRQLVRRALRRSPDAFVIVTGCYAQLNAAEIAAIPGVDLVLGSAEKAAALDFAGGLEKRALPQVFVSCIGDETECRPAASGGEDGRTRAYLKVQDGCDFPCSFCTIPLARGGSRSVPAARLVDEARRLGEAGYREVILTGVNVGDYRGAGGEDLLGLLRLLAEVDAVERFRVSSIEPNLLGRELVRFILDSGRFARHFHVPLQSGSPAILRAMRRRYTAGRYAELIGEIRAADPEAGIGADVIVGFPGETDALFGETVRLLEELPLSYLHVFTFSEREDTPAASMGNPVEPRVRFHRSGRLRELGRRKRLEFHRRFLGATLDVLVERTGGGGGVAGLTSNYIRVSVAGSGASGAPVNSVLPVVVTGADEEGCAGIPAGAPFAAAV